MRSLGLFVFAALVSVSCGVIPSDGAVPSSQPEASTVKPQGPTPEPAPEPPSEPTPDSVDNGDDDEFDSDCDGVIDIADVDPLEANDIDEFTWEGAIGVDRCDLNGNGVIDTFETDPRGIEDDARSQAAAARAALAEEQPTDVFEVTVGDCIAPDTEAGAGEINSVGIIGCSEPHEFEVYHAFELADGDGRYPGDSEVSELADAGCYDAFEPFVGLDYESSIYGYTSLTPTEQGWDSLNDREVLCMIGNYDESLKSGSAAGTGL